ncbi:DUF6603 domain-containing protein, partial [Streptomyces sp. NPDC001667]
GVEFGGFSSWFERTFGAALPGVVAGLVLDRFVLDVNSKLAGSVEVVGSLPVGAGQEGAVFSLKATVGEKPPGGSRPVTFGGELTVWVDTGGAEPVPLVFRGDLASGPAASLSLSWSVGESGTGVPLSGLLSGLGFEDAADLVGELPAGLTPALTGASVVWDRSSGLLVVAGGTERVGVLFASLTAGQPAVTRRLVGVRGGVGVGLSDLPLVGSSVPKDLDVVVDALSLLYADQVWTAAQLEAVKAAVAGLPAGLAARLPVLPVVAGEGLLKGVTAAGVWSVGGAAMEPLVLRPRPLGGGSGASLPPGTGPGGVVRVGEGVGGSREVGAVFGPVRVRRVSLGYANGRARVTFDVTFTVGPVVLDLIGLGLELEVAGGGGFSVRPVLSGAGVRVDRPPLRITGVFERRQEAGFDEYLAGLLAVETGFVALDAAGVYARADRAHGGWQSVFFFGEVAATGEAVLFAAPPFAVKGISGGFGVNSTLKIPEVDQIGTFPLVNRLGAGNAGDSPLDVLHSLEEWVRPAEGSYWGAAGVEFTIFKFIEARALLMAEFGRELNVVLLGRTSVTFPRNRPGPGGKVHARLEVDLRLAYQRSKGLLSLDAAVGAGSFLFSEACRLTGGIAVYVWTAREHAGDFVLTAGGYHPNFTKPAHYPAPARLGFVWSPDDKVMVKAEVYTALTPSSFMIGGRLSATYDKGLLSAWFTAYLDAWIQWKPFFLDLRLGISIGVAFTIKVWFVKVRVSIEVGIDLALWTPPFGGRVTVKVWFVSFSFDIGSSKQTPALLSWPEVRAQLPAPVGITFVQGLLVDVDPQVVTARREAGLPVLVSSAGFVFTTESAVPATKITLNNTTPTVKEGCQPWRAADNATFGIRPMGKEEVTGEHQVTLTRNTSTGDTEYTPPICCDSSNTEERCWDITAVAGGVPKGLWGRTLEKPEQAAGEAGLLSGFLTGLRFAVPGPSNTGQSVGPVTSQALDVEPVDPDGVLTSSLSRPDGPTPHPDNSPGGSIGLITRTIDDLTPETGAVARRAKAFTTLNNLGLSPGADGSRAQYARTAADTLVTSPLTTAAL